MEKQAVRPWDDDLDLDDDQLEKLWELVRADEFCFVFGGEGEERCVAITPLAFFKKDGCQYDQHLLIEHLLPSEEWCDVMEGVYEYPGTEAEARQELLSRGFVDDPGFVAFMNKH